jgi:hypothetical protein
MFALPARLFAPDRRPPVAPEVHISYGQSWRVNDFPSFGAFGFNPQPQTLLALKTSTMGGGLGPGPMPNSAGIAIPGTIIGVTGYQASNTFALGRCAVAAMQLWRLAGGATYLPPILEFCAGYPGSTWETGGGGGLSPGATFTASIVNGSMTVTAVSSRKLSQWQMLMSGPGIAANTMVLDGPNPGTTGTYRVAVGSSTVPGTPFTTSGGASFTGRVGAAALSDTLVVDSVQSGTIVVGDTITNGMPGGTPATTIQSFISGTSGGPGTYQVLIGSPINVASGPLSTSTNSWRGLTTILNAIASLLPTAMQAEVDAALEARGVDEPPAIEADPADFMQFDVEERQAARVLAQAVPADPDLEMAFRDIVAELAPRSGYLDATYRSAGYWQGGAADNTAASKVNDLTDMLLMFDSLNLPGPAPLNWYFQLPAGISYGTVYTVSNYATVQFCRTHAPGQGGQFSGRVFFCTSMYPWQFNGTDWIHTGDYGTARGGEWEGYIKHLVEDLGIAWTPLWRPLTGGAITRSGTTFTIPFARPAGPDFATAVMVWQNNREDGVKEWPQKGFHVYRGGTELPLIATPVISGLTVIIDIGVPALVGDEVSYAWYGPGGPNPSTDPGIGGNLVMNGPRSVLFPNGWNSVTKTLDAWAVPFVETVTV